MNNHALMAMIGIIAVAAIPQALNALYVMAGTILLGGIALGVIWYRAKCKKEQLAKLGSMWELREEIESLDKIVGNKEDDWQQGKHSKLIGNRDYFLVICKKTELFFDYTLFYRTTIIANNTLDDLRDIARRLIHSRQDKIKKIKKLRGVE